MVTGLTVTGFSETLSRLKLSKDYSQSVAKPLANLAQAMKTKRSTATKTFFGVRTVSQHLQLEQPDQRSELPTNAIGFRTVSLTYRTFFNSSRYQTKVQSGGSGPKRISSQGQPRAIQLLNPNRLKIVGGTAKGKKIDSPDVYLRPMMAKVREALFSTLSHVGAFNANTTRVLDMFAGSGSVGIEALSRGACHTTFVDLAPECTQTAMRNALNCGFEGQASFVCARAEDVLTDPSRFGLNEPYGLISITPPYEEVIYKILIDAVCNSPLVVQDTLVVIEYPVEMGTLPFILGHDKLYGIRNRKYGRTVLGLYVFRPNKKYDMRPDEFLSLK